MGTRGPPGPGTAVLWLTEAAGRWRGPAGRTRTRVCVHTHTRAHSAGRHRARSHPPSNVDGLGRGAGLALGCCRMFLCSRRHAEPVSHMPSQ